MEYTKDFWINIIIFIIVLVALGLSIWSFMVKCKDNYENICHGSPLDINVEDCFDLTKDECSNRYFSYSKNRGETINKNCKWNETDNSCGEGERCT